MTTTVRVETICNCFFKSTFKTHMRLKNLNEKGSKNIRHIAHNNELYFYN